MNRSYKAFVLLFIAFQSLFIFDMWPHRLQASSYNTEVLLQIILSISKVNHKYNFFTSKQNSGGYNYTTNDIFMFKQENGLVKRLKISHNGLLNNLVTPINAARINSIQSVSLVDTLLYNAIVRSEAIFFFKENKSYPLIYFEISHHNCYAVKAEDKLIKREKTNIVYSSYFH